MNGRIRRAGVMAGAAAVLLGSAVGVASADSVPALSWAPTTSSGADNYGTVTVGQTASQTFTLTSSGGAGALTIKVTGSAAFSLATDGCSGTTLNPGTLCRVTVTYAPATGTATDSATLTATATKPAASASLALTGTGAKASPGIATAPSAIGAGGAGETTVTDTVALAGGDKPGGHIEFQLFGPSTSASCAGAAVFDTTVTVTGDGSYSSPPFTPAAGGSYWWTATYNGDGNNTPAGTNCGDERLNINPAPHLYWSGADGIMRANLDGTGVTTLLPGQRANGVAVDSSHIYWTTVSDPNSLSSGTIMEANLDGTGVTTLISGLNDPLAVAVGGSHIYWTDNRIATINEANLDGTGATELAIRQVEPYGVAVDGSHIYWTTNGGLTSSSGTIMEANLDGSNPQTLVSGQNDLNGVAVDGSHIIWTSLSPTNDRDGLIQSAHLDGTGVAIVATGQDLPGGVAGDGGHIFWDSLDAGAIIGDTLFGPQTLLPDNTAIEAMALGP
jgi:uncharacterized protein DUF5050/centrosomal CEP192-like protein